MPRLKVASELPKAARRQPYNSLTPHFNYIHNAINTVHLTSDFSDWSQYLASLVGSAQSPVDAYRDGAALP